MGSEEEKISKEQKIEGKVLKGNFELSVLMELANQAPAIGDPSVLARYAASMTDLRGIILRGRVISLGPKLKRPV